MAPVAWLLVLIACVGAFRDIEFKNCKSSTGSLSCKVKAVEVNGCLSPSSWVDVDGKIVEYQAGDVKSPCRIDSGSTLNFSITFEPGFSVSTVRSQFTLPELPECWGVPNTLDVQCPLVSATQVLHQGCDYTKCPLQAGRPQSYDSSVHISPSLNARSVNQRKIYQMRWKLWNNKDKKHNCCFNIPVQY